MLTHLIYRKKVRTDPLLLTTGWMAFSSFRIKVRTIYIQKINLVQRKYNYFPLIKSAWVFLAVHSGNQSEK